MPMVKQSTHVISFAYPIHSERNDLQEEKVSNFYEVSRGVSESYIPYLRLSLSQLTSHLFSPAYGCANYMHYVIPV